MTSYDRMLIMAVAFSEATLLVCLCYFRLLHRFPYLGAHLAVEALSQVIACWMAPQYYALAWTITQGPRLLLRAAVIWEVWHEATEKMDRKERRWLAATCVSACLLLVLASWKLPLLPPTSVSLLARQYLLLVLAVWLLALNIYLAFRPIGLDYNLKLYSAFATIGAVTTFIGGTFVQGGLGYQLMPWTLNTWSTVHEWRCVLALLMLMLFGVFVRSEQPVTCEEESPSS